MGDIAPPNRSGYFVGTYFGSDFLGFAIGPAVGAIVLISLSVARSSSAIADATVGIRIFFAFLGTEVVIFPIIVPIMLFHLIRRRGNRLWAIFLLSASVYLDIVFLMVANTLTTTQVLMGITEPSLLEGLGARLNFLLLVAVSFAGTSSFWVSQSFHSLTASASVPNWVSAIYALACAIFVYSNTLAHGVLPSPTSRSSRQTAWEGLPAIAGSVFIASSLAFLITIGSRLFLPAAMVGALMVLTAILALMVLGSVLLNHVGSY